MRCNTSFWRSAAATLAALLGVARAADIDPPLARAGSLSVAQERMLSGLQFNPNYGFGRVPYYRLRLLHGARLVAVPDATGRGKQDELRDLWLLPGADRPAALIADARWTLVSEQNERLRIDTLGAQPPKSLHWLDGPASGEAVRFGHTRHEPFTSTDTTLRGGRFVLLDGELLLDLKELRARPITLDAPPGYKAVSAPVLGLSPDGRALALLYEGESRSSRDALIVVTGTQRAERQLLPIDLKPCTGQDHVATTPGLLARCFQWASAIDSAMPRLQLRPTQPAVPWRVDYAMGLRAPRGADGAAVSRFELTPVKATMLQAARDALSEHCGCRFEPVPSDPSGALQYVIPTGTAVMRYDATRKALVVESAEAGGKAWSQVLMRRFGERIEEQLVAGVLNDHLLPQQPNR